MPSHFTKESLPKPCISCYFIVMKRDCYQTLLAWKDAADRKPLVLRGARQVGKTHLLKQFAQNEYDNSLYLDFEEMPSIKSFFQGDLDPKTVLEKLELYSGQKFIAGQSLLVFDEIQACPEALNSLKYFCENAPEINVVAAGSLLGIKLANTKGFPVGKVNFCDLFPVTFFEFLDAVGSSQLREYLENISSFKPLDEPIHDRLIELLKKYMFIGGMPEAITKYVNTQDMFKTRDVQRAIIDAYLLDFSKHVPKDQLMKVTDVWNSIPAQLSKENKKFKFTEVKSSARAREYEDSIQWLCDANLILKCTHLHTPRLPLSAYTTKNFFKTYLVDIGLLGALSDLSPRIIVEGHQLFFEFKGALTENYVAQSLKASSNCNLYYWASQATAEVDFIVAHDMDVYPFEVKAGNSKKKKSLLVYEKKYHPSKLIRTSLRNLKQDNNLYNLPLYLISRLQDLMNET